MNLRDYQSDAVNATIEAFNDVRSALIVLPTGCGKTVVFSHIAKTFRPDKRVLILAHREELIRQAAVKIEAITGDPADIEMAGEYADQGNSIFAHKARVVVSSIQTQQGRMTRFDPKEFGLIITDEAHHAPAPSYRKVFDYYLDANPEMKHLGVTATPDRADEEALGQIYEVVAANYEIIDAILDGWLVRVLTNQVPVADLDLSTIRTTAGDFNQGDLSEALEQERVLQRMIQPVIEITNGFSRYELNWFFDNPDIAALEKALQGRKRRKTLIFATSVRHAELLSEILNRAIPSGARWICGTTPKDVRAQTLVDYAAGKFQYLVNVGVFTEGFDEPTIEVIVMARPTKSRALYAQMAGRGTRPLPGIVDGLATAQERRDAITASAKPSVEIIDFAGNTGRHKLVTAADILAGKHSDDVVNRASRKSGNGRAVDVIDAMNESAEEIKAEHESARKAELEKRRQMLARAVYETRAVDPFDVLGIEPEREYGWDRKRKITPSMQWLLKKHGVGTNSLDFGKAKQIIADIKRREQQGLCGYVQAVRLAQAGFDADVTPQQAAMILRQIAASKRQQPVTS